MKIRVLNFAWDQHQELIGSIGTIMGWIGDCPRVKIGQKEYWVQEWEKFNTPKIRSIFNRRSIAPSLRFKVFQRDKFSCQYCGMKSPDVILHIDHKIPVAKGGMNTETNLITACEKCNIGKGILSW